MSKPIYRKPKPITAEAKLAAAVARIPNTRALDWFLKTMGWDAGEKCRQALVMIGPHLQFKPEPYIRTVAAVVRSWGCGLSGGHSEVSVNGAYRCLECGRWRGESS